MSLVVPVRDDPFTLGHVRSISLARARKHAGRGPHRIASSRAAWIRVRRAIDVVGITRLADVTGLDRVGIPTWSAIRPQANRFSVSVTCGKGLRSIEARIGAVMEAVEYWAAEPPPRHVRVARMDELRDGAIDPESLILPSWSRGCARDALAWCGGWDLTRQRAVWVPANAVFFPFENQAGRFLFTPTTNGLAAGLVVEEAICHAIAELIERDAWSIACAQVWTAGNLDGSPPLDLASIPASAKALVERFERSGLRVVVRVITSDIRVAAFHATVSDRGSSGLSVHEGMGAHPDSEIALLRALTEAAQSRVADIQGSREDLTYWRARSRESGPRGDDWLEPDGPPVDFATVPRVECAEIRADIDWMLARLRDAGLDRVIVVDLTSAALDVPVVRVIVPGLEIMCVDPWRTGRRIKTATDRAPRSGTHARPSATAGQ